MYGKYVIGIDISTDSLNLAVHASDRRWQFTNDDAGIASLCQVLAELKPTLVAFEATGCYELSLYVALDTADGRLS